MRFSLKTKMTLVLSTLFFALVPTVGYLVQDYLKKDFITFITEQQDNSVTIMAEDLDVKLAMVQDVLVSVATNNVPPELFSNPKAAQKFLNERYTLKSLFAASNGIFFFSPDGKIVAETAIAPARIGFDISDRDYFKRTIATRRPVISSAYASSQPHHHPSIMFTAPVFHKDGTLAGILGGSLDLLRPNFVGELADDKIGKSGYYFLLDTERTNIVHHDRSRIMKRDVPLGSNKLFDRAMTGFNGTGETINSRGIPMLATFKHLKKTNWILAANLPLEEAYAPVRNMEFALWMIVIFGNLLVAALVWLSMRHMIRPLISLSEQVKEITPSRRVAVNTNDEIHELAEIFNRQLETIEAGELKIQKEREIFRTISDFASDWIFWRDAHGTILYCSPSCETLCGYSPEDIQADPGLVDRMIHPDDMKTWTGHKHEADAGGNPVSMQFRIITRSGETRWIDHACRPICSADGTFIGTRGSNRDITNFKKAQDTLQEQATLLEQEVAERQVAQEGLAVKQQQLEALNLSLEERIRTAIEELRTKDQMVIQQNRLAAMGEMINNIAHQWRQPLNNIGLILQNIRYEYDAGLMTPATMAEDVEQEMKILGYMSQTIDDFRRFYRTDKEKSLFSVAESIQRSVSLVSASMKDNGIRVVVEQGDDFQVNGYPNEYAQVLLNLLCNSRDALIQKGIAKPVITVRTAHDGTRTVVTVTDNAGGIPDEVIPRVFDPYFTTKEQGKGTGIGLYMSKTIIEKNMGGSLTVRNSDDGAEFRVEV